MLKTKTVTHEGPGRTLQVTVSEASALMGMRRSVLISEALTYIREQREEEEPSARKGRGLDDDSNLAAYLLRRYAWPDCITCAIASEGFDHQGLTFEEFCQLPEAFIGQWQDAARELNPHWRGEEADEEETAKKGGNVDLRGKTSEVLPQAGVLPCKQALQVLRRLVLALRNLGGLAFYPTNPRRAKKRS